MLDSTKIIECITDTRAQIFGPLLLEYSMEFIAEEELWQFYIPELFAYYPRDLYFVKDELLPDNALVRLKMLKKANQPSFFIQDNILIKDKASATVVALYHGWQKDSDSYCMQVSSVHRDYRRKGIYSALLDRIIEYTKILGFNTVVSYHAPSNNAVLIAKLKKNFKITSLEISGDYGINLWLCYFHNKELERAYEFRCGQIDFSQRMYQASHGTAEDLLRKLKAAENTDSADALPR